MTIRQTYDWFVPVNSYGRAHVFVGNERLSLCVRHERWPLNQAGWEREQLVRGEPRRMRCDRCQALVEACGNLQEGSAA